MEYDSFATDNLLCRPYARLAQPEPTVKGQDNGKTPLTSGSASAILQLWQHRKTPLPPSYILFCFTSYFLFTQILGYTQYNIIWAPYNKRQGRQNKNCSDKRKYKNRVKTAISNNSRRSKAFCAGKQRYAYCQNRTAKLYSHPPQKCMRRGFR